MSYAQVGMILQEYLRNSASASMDSIADDRQIDGLYGLAKGFPKNT
jgi:hypothetical protein